MEGLAHYARATRGYSVQVPVRHRGPCAGQRDELEGPRSDFDLSQHEVHSGKALGSLRRGTARGREASSTMSKIGLSKRYFVIEVQEVSPERPGSAAHEETPADCEKLSGRGAHMHPACDRAFCRVGPPRSSRSCAYQRLYHERPRPTSTARPRQRTVLRFHPRVAPIKVGVIPLLKNKPELVAKPSRCAVSRVRG